jgi:hypothetical protein
MKKKKNFDELTIVMIVAVIAIIVSVIDYSNDESPLDTDKITGLILAKDNIVDTIKLKEIRDTEYSKLKKDLNIDKDFCMYLIDEKGNVLLAKGSSKIDTQEARCSE